MEQIYYTQCPMGYGLGASNGFQVKRISEGYPPSADSRHLGLRAYPGGGRTLANKRTLIDAGPGTPDGMRCDMDGNLWCGWGMGSPDLDGVMVFAPDGKPIGRIALPERCANLCFGGVKRNRLFMAAAQSVYALYVNTQGALGG